MITPRRRAMLGFCLASLACSTGAYNALITGAAPPTTAPAKPRVEEKDETVGERLSRETVNHIHLKIPTELMEKPVRWAIVPDDHERRIQILLDEHLIFDNTVEPMEYRRPAVWLFRSEALKPGEYTVTVIDPATGEKSASKLEWPDAKEVQIWLGKRIRVEVDRVSGWR